MRNAIARVIFAIGALAVAACGGQTGSIPASGLRGPTSLTQAVASQPVSVLTGGMSAPAQTQEAVLYSFTGHSDGDRPVAGLTDLNGTLYGTTAEGGVPNGYGTVFKITTAGAEKAIYHFKSGSDGKEPVAGLTDVGGVLYGTTSGGGDANEDGTVFAITTSGAESVLYRFAGGSDGSHPAAALTNVNGVLYGTTFSGGDANGDGTVFAITISGAETVLHRFQGGDDGANPSTGLTNVNGVLYGLTQSDGANPNGQGTVFKITTSGAESVLHSFGGGNDGYLSRGTLANVNGVLYGTTLLGGAFFNGIIFKITTSGTETILHSFGGGNDGAGADAGLIDVNGVLYGTTDEGGGNGKAAGTIFKITTEGVKSAVYRFLGGSDGAEPRASLTNVNGVLYGTTYSGGADSQGTVFSLKL